MKNAVFILLFVSLYQGFSVAQDIISPEHLDQFDRLNQKLQFVEDDTAQVKVLLQLCNLYKFNKPDSAIYYGNKALILANQINFHEGILDAMSFLATTYIVLDNDSKALQICLQGIKLSVKYKLDSDKAKFLFHLGRIYRTSEKYEKALQLFRQSITNSGNDKELMILVINNIGTTYRDMNLLDSALFYNQLARTVASEAEIAWPLKGILRNLGLTYKKIGDLDSALHYFSESLNISNNVIAKIDNYMQIARVYQQLDKLDSSSYYASKAFSIAQKAGIYSSIIETSTLMSTIYEKMDIQKAISYNKILTIYKDSLDYIRRQTALEVLIDFDEQQRQYELESAKKDYRYRIRRNAFLGSLFTLFVIAIFLYRNNKLKQRSKRKVEIAYDRLKNTQSQLIQSEKMASLGELTAGIAHEIQNPLNFVNNFSDVSQDLIDEMQEELNLGNPDVAREISEDVKKNLSKIHHHGERASGIVKGMLEHSRTGDGVKELTDINALADEYLRLAYHGLRAKDKSFNADFKTEFDESMPKINVVPQDIGRVLLNLINNAFYACTERSRSAGSDYQPLVEVSTKSMEDKIEISVKDNGPGIPGDIKKKIFQPFFTTKPTGSGTGLGLSLSYDIVKAHGGTISVESNENEGSEFAIVLPVKLQP